MLLGSMLDKKLSNFSKRSVTWVEVNINLLLFARVIVDNCVLRIVTK